MNNIKSFIFYANIILGSLCGLLVALPVAGSLSSPIPGLFLIIFSVFFGGFAGYRNKGSRAFMYMCLAFVLILSTLISFSMK